MYVIFGIRGANEIQGQQKVQCIYFKTIYSAKKTKKTKPQLIL